MDKKTEGVWPEANFQKGSNESSSHRVLLNLPEVTENNRVLHQTISDLISKQEQYQTALHNYELLISNLSDVIWRYDFNRRQITYISPSVYQQSGFNADELILQNPRDILHPESWKKVRDLQQHYARAGSIEPSEPHEFRLEIAQYHKSGHIIWIEANIKLLTDSQNHITEIVGVNRNIDKRKEDERQKTYYSEELEKINLVKDRFFSIIAHELRGPVGNMDTFLDYLIRNFQIIDKEALLEDICLIKETSQSVYELLERLLVWARAQKSEVAFTPKIHNLSRIVDSTQKLYSIILSDKNIALINNIPPELNAYFDYDMIKTVIRNLINNAIKFSHPGGTIDISAKRTSNDQLLICVKDEGVGMDTKTAENLFRLDVNQNSRPGTQGEKGTGLGLILCRDFIKKHGGEIWISSESGKGSSACFTIPTDDKQ